MGAEQSKSTESDEKVFQNETPIQFDPNLVNHLSDKLSSPHAPDSTRQSTLDSHIRARIQAELERLHEEEASVRGEIERALEKENLDKETELAKQGEDGEKKGASSEALRGDLEEVQKKAERFKSRKSLEDLPEIKAKKEALVKCYDANPKTPLDCWREVEEFKSSVAVVEKTFVDSLR
ncbi:hypothetical protein FRC03_010596 [Tulasnella sp. 419]|nr:hypothetical protein FRC03_010596 [Tulasnella sp. 419]